MHLFVLYLHPLLEKILQICDNPHELVVAYADDISVIVADDHKLDQIKQAFADFGLCSGAVLNTNKTVSINIGRQQSGRRTPSWLNVSDSVKILGISFFNSLKQTINFNWGEVIRKTFQLTFLTVFQKVILVNTYITSKLWFMASILSIPNAAVARMTSQIGSFIWERYPTRVAMEQLGLPIDQGGLNLHLPMQKCKALLINRFVHCQTNMPFAESFGSQLKNPPNPAGVPALYPCLKTLARELAYLPPRLAENPSTTSLLSFFREKANTPKIIEENQDISWKRV